MRRAPTIWFLLFFLALVPAAVPALSQFRVLGTPASFVWVSAVLVGFAILAVVATAQEQKEI